MSELTKWLPLQLQSEEFLLVPRRGRGRKKLRKLSWSNGDVWKISDIFADQNSTDFFKARNFVRTSLEKRNRLRQDLWQKPPESNDVYSHSNACRKLRWKAEMRCMNLRKHGFRSSISLPSLMNPHRGYLTGWNFWHACIRPLRSPPFPPFPCVDFSAVF